MQLNRPYFGTTHIAQTASVFSDRRDYFVISLTGGKNYTLTLSGGAAATSPFSPPTADLDVNIRDRFGTILYRGNLVGSSPEIIPSFRITTTGSYTVLVFSLASTNSPVVYRLETRDRP